MTTPEISAHQANLIARLDELVVEISDVATETAKLHDDMHARALALFDPEPTFSELPAKCRPEAYRRHRHTIGAGYPGRDPDVCFLSDGLEVHRVFV